MEISGKKYCFNSRKRDCRKSFNIFFYQTCVTQLPLSLDSPRMPGESVYPKLTLADVPLVDTFWVKDLWFYPEKPHTHTHE